MSFLRQDLEFCGLYSSSGDFHVQHRLITILSGWHELYSLNIFSEHIPCNILKLRLYYIPCNILKLRWEENGKFGDSKKEYLGTENSSVAKTKTKTHRKWEAMCLIPSATHTYWGPSLTLLFGILGIIVEWSPPAQKHLVSTTIKHATATTTKGRKLW